MILTSYVVKIEIVKKTREIQNVGYLNERPRQGPVGEVHAHAQWRENIGFWHRVALFMQHSNQAGPRPLGFICHKSDWDSSS